MPAAIPILVYHSVADPHDHPFAPLSLDVALFERQLQYLRRCGYETVTLYDVHDCLRRGSRLPRRSIALTFDDGYLDNWVHAFPLLKKYGMRATIFVTTDFVDPYDGCRATLENVWAGTIARQDLQWWGYVSWPELRAMQESGLIDVQAHTKTHTWYFVGDTIVDFHHPGGDYFWLDWNARPAEKPGWLTRDPRADVPWGTPVYVHAQTLLAPRYFDDRGLADASIEYVATHGGRSFFDRPQWRHELNQRVADYRGSRGCNGRYESDADYTVRVTDEMAGCRELIRDRLGRSVDFLAWPCGDYNPWLQRLAIEECGYLATVNVEKVANRVGDDPTELRRIGFGQDYRGRWQSDLIFMNFCGNVRYHSGARHAYPLAPLARRLMRLANATAQWTGGTRQ